MFGGLWALYKYYVLGEEPSEDTGNLAFNVTQEAGKFYQLLKT